MIIQIKNVAGQLLLKVYFQEHSKTVWTHIVNEVNSIFLVSAMPYLSRSREN